MTHRLLVVPTGRGVGLTSVCLGIVRALDQLGAAYGFVKPISVVDEEVDRSNALVRLAGRLEPPDPIPRREAEDLLGQGQEAVLLERVVELVERAGKDKDVLVVEGLVPVAEVDYAARLNIAVAKAIDAELVLVSAPTETEPAKIADNIDIAARAYGEVTGDAERCCILNMVDLGEEKEPPTSRYAPVAPPSRSSLPPGPRTRMDELRKALEFERFYVLGIIPREPELAALRTKELAERLGAEVIHEGAWDERRVHDVVLCAATVRNAYQHFTSGKLIITPGDREDILLAAALSELEGASQAGILLTGGRRPEPGLIELCRPAMDLGLPILSVSTNSFETARAVHETSRDVPPDDHERAEMVMRFVAAHLDRDWLAGLQKRVRVPRMTTPAFRFRLIEKAREAKRTIVLPEGDEPRTVAAAAICAEREIAECVLLAKPESVAAVSRRDGVQLPSSVRIIDPATVKDRYVEPMVELRRHKGLTAAMARDQLDDSVVLGTMMLALDEVHGLVSGAVHTTANTIRPALQLIKTAPGAAIVSSVFFMCLPEQVLVYGDCAVNPNPTAEELAEIALQSADSAAAFGIEPRVAMISYSTGTSGAGTDVEKVALATKLAQGRRPDLLIDGPLQYDAAAVKAVGGKKAPDSPVAGRATVFVFPDLNTGNTTYKAVQRSAHVVSMGPMLQGLTKPVNDLSRGALVEDIVFTIALTAIQAASIRSE
jgi:phosphate acetyltransferase